MSFELRAGYALEADLVFLHPHGPVRVHSGLQGSWSNHPFHSAWDDDHALTWVEEPCPAGLQVLVCQDSKHGQAPMHRTEVRYRSEDGGRTWARVG